MKRPFLTGLISILLFTATQAQQIDKYADFYFYSAYNLQPEDARQRIKTDSALGGFFLITHIQVDTLNKHELRTPGPGAVGDGTASATYDGVTVGLVTKVAARDGSMSGVFDYLQGSLAAYADSFQLKAVSRTGLNPPHISTGFSATIGKGAPLKARYFEQTRDSAAIYRTTASHKKMVRVEVPAYLSNATVTAWPGSATVVFGRGVLTTDAFYVQDDNFKGRFLLKRYTIDFVYRSVVQKAP